MKQAIIENAKKMIMMGLYIEIIYKVTELPIDKIKSFKKG